MKKIREWAFPVGLGVAWVATSAYVVWRLSAVQPVLSQLM
jgi:hypothetical protein